MKGLRRLGRAFKKNENGSAALIVGPAMFGLLGVTAVSVDTMNAFTAKEQLLTTAQAAASAAASVMPDRNKAAEAALIYAEANLKGAPSGSVVTREDIQFGNWDKATNTFTPAGAGEAGNAIRVTASRTSEKGNAVQTIFGRVLGFDTLGDMSMSATASRFDGMPCINALADSGKGLTLSSQAKIEMGDCPVHVRSTSSDALTLESTAKITAEEVCINGGYVQRSSNEVMPEPGLGCTSVSQDPFVNLPPPPTSSDSCLFTNKPPIDGEFLGLIQNAVYCGGLHITGNSTVVLPPGVYTMRGGKLKVDAGSTLMGEGVTIYLTGNDTVLDFSDGANINLSAPTEGPHAGILFFQDRNYDGQHNLSTNVNATLDGALYFPAGTLNVNGNSTLSAAASCLMIVADRVNIDAIVTGESGSSITAPSSSLCPPSPYMKRSVVVM